MPGGTVTADRIDSDADYTLADRIVELVESGGTWLPSELARKLKAETGVVRRVADQLVRERMLRETAHNARGRYYAW